MMFSQMFTMIARFLASSYLVPFWTACGGVVMAAGVVVFIKGVFVEVINDV